MLKSIRKSLITSKFIIETIYTISLNNNYSSYVFWFGDLNFRLAGNDSPEDVRALVEANKLNELLERDQLVLVRRDNKAFQNLEERLPEFPPTFKFKEGTSNYDMK